MNVRRRIASRPGLLMAAFLEGLLMPAGATAASRTTSAEAAVVRRALHTQQRNHDEVDGDDQARPG